MTNILYTYGTLRPGGDNIVKAQGQLFDLGWFPGVKLDLPGEFVCEPVEIEDWASVDRYEGYMPHDPANSLYIRKPFLDGFIYEYNQWVNPVKLIRSGDWLDYRQEQRGLNGGRFGKVS